MDFGYIPPHDTTKLIEFRKLDSFMPLYFDLDYSRYIRKIKCCNYNEKDKADNIDEDNKKGLDEQTLSSLKHDEHDKMLRGKTKD